MKNKKKIINEIELSFFEVNAGIGGAKLFMNLDPKIESVLREQVNEIKERLILKIERMKTL